MNQRQAKKCTSAAARLRKVSDAMSAVRDQLVGKDDEAVTLLEIATGNIEAAIETLESFGGISVSHDTLYTCLRASGCVKGDGHKGPCFAMNGERLTAFTQQEQVKAIWQAAEYVESGFFPKVNGGTDFTAWSDVTRRTLLSIAEDLPSLYAAREALAEAAREIPVAGPVARRIRVMRQEWSDTLGAARNFTQADVLNLRAEAFAIRKQLRETGVLSGPEYELQELWDSLADRIEALVPGHSPGHPETPAADRPHE